MPGVIDPIEPGGQPAAGDAVSFLRRRWPPFVLLVVALAAAAGTAVVSYYYVKLAHRIDAKLRRGPFSDTIDLYAAPRTLAVGDAVTVEELVRYLRQCRYSPNRGNRLGWYNLRPDAVEVFPGPESYFAAESGVIRIAQGKITQIISLNDNTERQEYQLEPQLITNVSDKSRSKRRLVRYSEIPRALVEAVISVEDKHFFQHSGFDLFRIAKAAWVDLREGRKEQGASTLSMQLARDLWLDPDKSWRRKAAEFLMALHLEARLSKQQIFEYYANAVYLGRRGTFNIVGFGEGARVFFGEDIGRLTVPQAATLAGMVQRPSYLNPLRYPQRAIERRNIVLWLMRQNGYLTGPQYLAASRSPLALAPAGDGSLDAAAPYFIDLVDNELQARFGEGERPASSVYTTLDPILQRYANQAVRVGMESVDKLLRKGKRGALPPNQPQVALVALDPHDGSIKAIVGGRNYGASQLNRVLARRQPGSVFKPFVYAAALDTAVEGGATIFTPASTLLDEPTTFFFANQVYQPGNFGGRFMGEVTLRTALAESLNVATVRLAQMVGFGRVAAIALRCGMPGNLRATPAIALGAYEASPLDVAGAYTVFANQGNYVRPSVLAMVRGQDGAVLYRGKPQTRRALDPRVAYLTVNIMQQVLRSGTGAGVRRLGFLLPAAGKTGTSRDGWFAGFTSELLCVVWVGFDDNRDLNLEGAKSALPIWTGFMKRAQQIRQYGDARPFAVPRGIVMEDICDDSGLLATPQCPETHSEFFVDGSQPVKECPLHGPPQQLVSGAQGEPMVALPAADAPTAPPN